MMDPNTVFLLIATIIIVGFLANLVFKRTKIPDLVWLLVLGLLLGPVFKVVSGSYFMTIMPYISNLALLLILFNAGLNMSVYKVIEEVPRGILISFTCFMYSMFSVAIISSFFLGMEPILSLLLGSIVGGVSSAIVIPTIENLSGFGEEPTLILDIESAATDPLVIVVSIAIIELIQSGTAFVNFSAFSAAMRQIVGSFSISIVIGFLAGLFWLFLLKYLRQEKYYYMLTLGYLFLIYPLVQMMNGNGSIAAFLIGLVLGNGKDFGQMLHLDQIKSGVTKRTKKFQSEITFFIKTFFFVTLGMLITFKKPVLFVFGGSLTLLLLLFRWIAIRQTTFGLDLTKMEKNVMSFMIPRGLSSAVLAFMVLELNVTGISMFKEIVFSVILGTGIVTTLGVFWAESKNYH